MKRLVLVGALVGAFAASSAFAQTGQGAGHTAPKAQPATDATPAMTQSTARPPVNMSEIPSLRLLLVDDDPAVLHSTRVVLELDGHAITSADGGDAGIHALRQAKDSGSAFDVIVTDLGMPYVDGQQLARAAKELFPSTTVVLLTGWGRKMSDGDDQSAHVDWILSKPLDLDELRSVFVRRFEGGK